MELPQTWIDSMQRVVTSSHKIPFAGIQTSAQIEWRWRS